MRAYLSAVMLFTLLGSADLIAEELRIKDEADRINYTIGHQIGADFKRQKVEFDSAAVQLGLLEGYNGNTPRLDPAKMGRVLGELKRKITADMKADGVTRLQNKKKRAADTRLQGRAFLERNRSRDGVRTLPSGLQYRVITAGTGARPQLDDQVRINYRARLIDGKEFSSSYRKGVPSTLRVSGVIPGFIEGLQMMRSGGKWELYLPPDLAYGRRGPVADQTVIIQVELLEIIASDEPPQPGITAEKN